MLTRELMQQALEALELIRNHGDTKATEAAKKAVASIAAIKAALSQPEQEPVAWMYTSKWRGNERFITHFQTDLSTYKADEVWPLFTSSPQRQPLTDDKIDLAIEAWFSPACRGCHRTRMKNAIEAALKEKNT